MEIAFDPETHHKVIATRGPDNHLLVFESGKDGSVHGGWSVDDVTTAIKGAYPNAGNSPGGYTVVG